MTALLQPQSTIAGCSTFISDCPSVQLNLEPYPYVLDLESPVPWPSWQETPICQDYPFSTVEEESLEDFVIRRYLETLWLPESIMPLQHFVQSLRRVLPSASGLHPLHAMLKPLLLSVRATQDKYHSELPQILQDGGGAGELEETVMWFAYSKEKFEQDTQVADGEGAKKEEEWTKSWMSRLERREVQIQILLYLQLLELPAATPSVPLAPSNTSKTHKRKQPRSPDIPGKSPLPPVPSGVTDNLTLDDRLEYFMDKLSLWQLIESLKPSDSVRSVLSQSKPRDERDWMQIFCEDVVEPSFKDRLPEQCALLRTKVFPHSPFSDDSQNAFSPPPPDLSTIGKGKARLKRPASPLRLTELQKPKPECSHPSSRRAESQEPGATQDHHRSRSRSVSISVEEVRARGASRGGVASSKSLFKDEIEMKRTAPRAPRMQKPTTAESQQGGTFSRQNSSSNPFGFASNPGTSQPRSPRLQEPMTFAADTPVKKSVKVEDYKADVVMDSPDALLLTGRPRGRREGEERMQGPASRSDITLVTDTPVKKRPLNR